MNIFKKILIRGTFIVCFFAGSSEAQEKVYMPFFEIINMNSGFQYSSSKLLKTYMEDMNKYVLLLPPKPDSLYPAEPFETTKVMAASYGAPYFIIGELNRVGETVLVSVSLYNTSDGVKVWGDKLKARNPDDIDPIIQRIAKNIGTSNKASEEGDIYSVTDYETKELKKNRATDYFGLFIGSTSLLSSIPFDKPLTGFGLIGSYDDKNLMMDIKLQGYWGNHYSVYDASLEVYYPFKSTARTPFVGGGFGMSGVNDNNYHPNSTDEKFYHGSGLMFMAGGGYIFNRTSSVQLRVSSNAYVGFYSVKGETPVGIMLRMEILFD